MSELKYGERICAKCGKEFLIHDGQWAYRANVGSGYKLFCSWHCLRAWEKEKPTKIDRREKIIGMIMDHPEMTASQIGKELGEEPTTVLYWVRKLSKQGVL